MLNSDIKLHNAKMQQVAFICSPFAKIDLLEAQYIAIYVASRAKDKGFVPISPIIAFDMIYTENNPNEREIVLRACEALLLKCDVVCVAITPYGISDGMRKKIALAKKHNKQIIYIEVKNNA